MKNSKDYRQFALEILDGKFAGNSHFQRTIFQKVGIPDESIDAIITALTKLPFYRTKDQNEQIERLKIFLQL
jgi:hypothetical protein